MTRHRHSKPTEPDILAGSGSAGFTSGSTKATYDDSTLREFQHVCAIYEANRDHAFKETADHIRELVASGISVVDQDKVFGYLRAKDIAGADGRDFKVNSTYKPIYIRLMLRDWPDLRPHVTKTRRSKFDPYFS